MNKNKVILLANKVISEDNISRAIDVAVEIRKCEVGIILDFNGDTVLALYSGIYKYLQEFIELSSETLTDELLEKALIKYTQMNLARLVTGDLEVLSTGFINTTMA